ncbi:MAG TPA: hypothetical protein VHE11_05910 [Steroidobacteraceae bacterium]|nr:hypothetical protein [Steroidobacteraceae bacterium]
MRSAGSRARCADELPGLKAPAAHAAGGIKNWRLYRRMQEIEKLPRRDQEALLRTIEALSSRPVEEFANERTP